MFIASLSGHARPRSSIVFVLLGFTVLPSAHAQDGYVFTTFAGKAGEPGSTNALLADARFKFPRGIAFDASGNMVIADSDNAVLRKIMGPIVNTFAGAVGVSGAADGALSAARFGAAFPIYGTPGPVTAPAGSIPVLNLPVIGSVTFGPFGVAAGPNDTLFVMDTPNGTIRAVVNGGTVTTIAGALQSIQVIGALPISARAGTDGTGTAARFVSPYAMAVAGNTLYVTDSNANAIRKITAGNVVTTYAGSLGTFGEADGDRLSARFRGPAGIVANAAGNIFVVDSNNYTIRQIAPDGTVSTLAGSAGQPGSVDGTRGQARFGSPVIPPPNQHPHLLLLLELNFDFTPLPVFQGPQGVALDAAGNLLVTDTTNHTIRKVTPTGVVTTVGGLAGSSGNADGLARVARFNSPTFLTFDRSGNLYVADTGNHTIRKGTPAYLPQIVMQPRDQSVNPGQAVTLTVSVTGTLAQTYQWTKNATAIPGATNATFTVASAQPSDAGTYAVTVTNDLGPVTSAAASVTVGSPPALSIHPLAQSVLGAQSVTLSVSATGTPTPTFQWLKDGELVAGATSSTLAIPSAQAGDAGVYTVVVTNAAGSVTSSAAAVTVNTSRIVNLSIRSGLSPGAPLLTVGFVVSGNDKNLLVRGVGPTLAHFGLINALADPRIALFTGASPLASNDNWGAAPNAAQVSTTTPLVGAFALGAGSSDAAVLTAFDGGSYTAQITGPANASGIVLVELYDANSTMASRLVNVSTRAQVGIGDNILVAGFVVSGNAPKTLLIRAIGPALSTFGVTGVLADPRLEIIGSGSIGTVAGNDNWGGTAALTAAFAAQGAFPLAMADSKDAALLVTLEPGSYSAQVSGINGTTGEALIEIYEVR